MLLLTLIVTPVAYVLLDDLDAWFARRRTTASGINTAPRTNTAHKQGDPPAPPLQRHPRH